MAALTGTVEDGLAFESLERFGFIPHPLNREFVVRLSRESGDSHSHFRHSQISAGKLPGGRLCWFVNGLGVLGPSNASDLTTLIWLVLGETP